jgi:Tfp pilus assembly protein PilF
MHAGSVDLKRIARSMDNGATAEAVAQLQMLSVQNPDDLAINRMLVYALREEQRLVEAHEIADRQSVLHPHDPALAFVRAQICHELGYPASGLFAAAHDLMPKNLDVLRNRAASLVTDGEARAAQSLLQDALAANPEWLEGHKALSALCWTGGDQKCFAATYERACKAQPGNASLWLAWFGLLAQTRDWAACAALLNEAEPHLGLPSLLAARLVVASESGDETGAEKLLADTAHIQGDAINLCRIRFHLRRRRLAEAKALAERLVTTTSAPLFWPYLSLIWRLLNDHRAQWLDNPDVFIRHVDVGLGAVELTELGELLRSLHQLRRPFVEQSVRGGTQTDRSVILRQEPILQRARAAMLDAIQSYIAALPAPETGHPLLGQRRDRVLIEGSWSVRLLAQGYNVPHTHPRGWLSTTLYVSLPGKSEMGAAPAGHIAFGTPPEELGLGLPAYRTLEPRAGSMVIFPSTLWHGTVPFNDGERLVLALDIRRTRN